MNFNIFQPFHNRSLNAIIEETMEITAFLLRDFEQKRRILALFPHFVRWVPLMFLFFQIRLFLSFPTVCQGRPMPPTPPRDKKWLSEERSMCIKHRKYRQKCRLGGARFGVFVFFIFLILHFSMCKKRRTYRKQRKYHQKMRPRTRLGGQKLFVFPTLKMWFGRFQKPKVVQNCVVLKKHCQNAGGIGVFACFFLLPWKM